MPEREIIGMVLGFIGGFGGLTSGLSWMSIVDLLNTVRPPEKQIPVAITSWAEFQRHFDLAPEYGFPFGHKLLAEFRRQFPDNQLHRWYIGGLVWMFSFGLVGAVMLFTAR